MSDLTLLLLKYDKAEVLPLASHIKDTNVWQNELISTKPVEININSQELKVSKEDTKKATYIKDCSSCRNLTKNCLFTCPNRVKFHHFEEINNYMIFYRMRESTIAKHDGIILDENMVRERKEQAEQYRLEFSRNPPPQVYFNTTPTTTKPCRSTSASLPKSRDIKIKQPSMLSISGVSIGQNNTVREKHVILPVKPKTAHYGRRNVISARLKPDLKFRPTSK